ncbi:hypothetical protein D210916BOD24_09550 [Alteromonas sp. D210916BOD_24]|uniref:hypothetical protein n=1 Tax=Alteromonas sp. D210916BOD_24 TaxID=3157618 RepID=UPI00399D3F9B
MRVQQHKIYAHDVLHVTKIPSRLLGDICVRLLISGLLSGLGALGTTAAIYAISTYNGSSSISDAIMAGLTVFSLTLCLTVFSETWTKAVQSTALITTAVLLVSGTLSFFM